MTEDRIAPPAGDIPTIFFLVAGPDSEIGIGNRRVSADSVLFSADQLPHPELARTSGQNKCRQGPRNHPRGGMIVAPIPPPSPPGTSVESTVHSALPFVSYFYLGSTAASLLITVVYSCMDCFKRAIAGFELWPAGA